MSIHSLLLSLLFILPPKIKLGAQVDNYEMHLFAFLGVCLKQMRYYTVASGDEETWRCLAKWTETR